MDAFYGYIIFVIIVVVLAAFSRLVAPIWIIELHFTWQLTLWTSEAFIRKVQPDNVFLNSKRRQLETTNHSIAVRRPHLVSP